MHQTVQCQYTNYIHTYVRTYVCTACTYVTSLTTGVFCFPSWEHAREWGQDTLAVPVVYTCSTVLQVRVCTLAVNSMALTFLSMLKCNCTLCEFILGHARVGPQHLHCKNTHSHVPAPILTHLVQAWVRTYVPIVVALIECVRMGAGR